MRLDVVYLVGSLWGGLTSPQICSTNAHTMLGLEPGASLSAAARATAFINVNVVPMDTERVLLNHTVLVEGGKITVLGPTSQVKIPADAVRIDGRGKYLIPGLADMHFGIAHGVSAPREGPYDGFGSRLFEHLARGVTAIRGLEGSPSNVEDLQRLRRVSATSGLPIQRLYVGRVINKQMQPDSMAGYIAAAKAAGYDHIVTDYGMKVRTAGERVLFDSAVAVSRRVGLPMASHSHALPFDAVLALGTTGGSSEHLFPFWDSLLGKPGPLTTMGLTNAPKVELALPKLATLAAEVKRAGVWMTPTLRCLEGVHPYITNLPQAVKVLQDAGVGLLLSGDDGYTVHDELAALVRAGLTPYQALLTGTRNVAQYLRLLDSSGTVAAGKWADLVLLSGNPLTDIHHAREPVGVMMNGRWLDRAALDQGLAPAVQAWFKSQAPLTALADSVEATKQDPRASEPLRRRLAAALATHRAAWTPNQRTRYDPYVRAWLREQVRQGHAVTIPDVNLTP